MKLILLFFCMLTNLSAQEFLPPPVEIYVWQQDNIYSDPVEYHFDAQSIVWDQNYNVNIIDPVHGDDIIITKFFIEGNMLTSGNGGWHFIISNGGGSNSQGYEYPVIGYGLYKVYTIQSPEYYFYIDYRNQDLGGNYDISIKFNTSSNTYSLFYGIAQNINQFVDIENKSIKRIWDIIGQDAPLNSDLGNFWQNCLVLIPSPDNHPRLVWAPHPTFNTTHYRIYRAVSNYPRNPQVLNYSLIATVSSSTFD